MRRILLLLGVMAAAVSTAAGVAPAPASDRGAVDEWRFRVFLDDSEIGYHNFVLIEEGGRRRVLTEAEFRVRFLFVPVYRYEHVNREVWRDGCLEEISSSTDANGKHYTVRGERTGEGFAVEAAGGRSDVGGCVKTFAYWNPGILDETVLLNSQTGELLPVEVQPGGVELLTVGGTPIETRRYRLRAKGMELDLWYSADQRWVALESTVEDGRKLRYELT
jgi:hypothetical protein